VTDSGGGVVVGAEVILYKENEFLESLTLEGDDKIVMPMPAETAGTVMVTVVAKDYKPYVGSCEVTQATEYCGYYSHTVDDDNSGGSMGNGDGVVNPNEIIDLWITVKNTGTTDMTNVAGLVSVRQGDASMLDDLLVLGSIPAGDTETGYVRFLAGPANGDGEEIVLELKVAGGSFIEHESEIRLEVEAPKLAYYSLAISGDGVLDPGETATLTVTLENEGGQDSRPLDGTLRTPTSGLTASDSAGSWGTVASGGTASNSGDTFQITAAAGVAVGHEFELVIDIEDDAGLSQFVVFYLVVGESASDDPGGPDDHGYYVYDNTDTGYTEAPTYSWLEIDPSYGGGGTDMGMAYDEMTDVALPFTFRFYGEEFNTIGICSNGNIGFGPQPVWEKQPRNTPIGAPLGPAGMAAPFWDDLDPSASGKVLYDNIGAGRFVVEWSRVQSVYVDTTSGTPYDQTFQLILYDQDVYPTISGDGEIVFQYHTIANADTANGATVGIENLDQTDGVEYSFFMNYPDHAAPLTAGRAIKFTTDPPDGYPSTGADDVAAIGVKILGNSPNPFNPVTRIAFSVPAATEAELSVYDISGRLVATLVSGEVDAGPHETVWNGTNEAGEPVASGVYFSRLMALGEEHSAKMVLLK
jgi:hypothetical protein